MINNTHEIAYRYYGETWKRKVFRTVEMMHRWLTEHDDDIAEVRFADDNGSEA